MISVTLEGGAELQRKLKALERKVGTKIVRQAVRAGHKITLDAVKQNAGTMVGGSMGQLIAKNTVLRAFKKQKRGSYGMSVQLKGTNEFIHVSKTDRAKHERYYIPAAIECGHDNVPAIPFIRDAFKSTSDKVVKTVSDQMRQEIEKAAKVV